MIFQRFGLLREGEGAEERRRRETLKRVHERNKRVHVKLVVGGGVVIICFSFERDPMI